MFDEDGKTNGSKAAKKSCTERQGNIVLAATKVHGDVRMKNNPTDEEEAAE